MEQANFVISMAWRVSLLPVPAISGTRFAVRSTAKRSTSWCSSSESVGFSPEVPQLTKASMPLSICQSMMRP